MLSKILGMAIPHPDRAFFFVPVEDSAVLSGTALGFLIRETGGETGDGETGDAGKPGTNHDEITAGRPSRLTRSRIDERLLQWLKGRLVMPTSVGHKY
jgi:hypothetical protein